MKFGVCKVCDGWLVEKVGLAETFNTCVFWVVAALAVLPPSGREGDRIAVEGASVTMCLR
ncbi:MAG: hypothetical protein ACI4QL_03960 [Candidatus Fimimonas sp.]